MVLDTWWTSSRGTTLLEENKSKNKIGLGYFDFRDTNSDIFVHVYRFIN